MAYDRVDVLTSAVLWCSKVRGSLSDEVVSSSLTDFLKSLMAPPTSLSQFFSLDVPNNKITTIAKISTCQIDKPAILFSSFLFMPYLNSST